MDLNRWAKHSESGRSGELCGMFFLFIWLGSGTAKEVYFPLPSPLYSSFLF